MCKWKALGNGQYDDVDVKTPDGWRFKSRTVTMPTTTPPATSSTTPPG